MTILLNNIERTLKSLYDKIAAIQLIKLVIILEDGNAKSPLPSHQ